MIEILVVQGYQIHGHADDDADRYDRRADQCAQTLFPIAADYRIFHDFSSFE